MPLDSTYLATYAAVIHEGSFEAAAQLLHITPSAISQRIKALEREVGQVLVRRSKPCQATQAGQPLLRLAGQIEVLEREALEAASGQLIEGQTRIRVSVVVNADSLATWFPLAMADLTEKLPVSFDLREDDQDHTAELLRDGSVMAAVTAQHGAVQGCRVERLGAMRYLAVASSGLAQRYFSGDGESALTSAFAMAPMMVFNRKDRLQYRFLRGLTKRRLDPPAHYVPSAWGFAEAIRLGLGWGLLPERVAFDYIDDGYCVDVAAGHYMDVALYWQCWRLDSSVLNELTAVVKKAALTILR